MIKWLDKLVSIVLHLLIPEFPGIPTNFFLFYDSRNSGITTYIGLFTNDQSWLSIEFRCGIPGIVRAWNRSGIGRNSRNWKEFPPIPGIPESQLTLACLRMISPGYRSNAATEFPELEGIPTDSRNSGSTYQLYYIF